MAGGTQGSLSLLVHPEDTPSAVAGQQIRIRRSAAARTARWRTTLAQPPESPMDKDVCLEMMPAYGLTFNAGYVPSTLVTKCSTCIEIRIRIISNV